MIKILLVEDNDLNRDMLARRLRRHGMEVVEALDGGQALEVATAEQPDLILMDMNLPEMDGWEATRSLRADASTQHIPVIALTAHAMVGDRERALAVGCNEYETKPVDFVRLLTKIQVLVGRSTDRKGGGTQEA